LFALLGQQYRADEFAAAIKTLRRTELIMAQFHTCYDVLLTASARTARFWPVATVWSR